MTTIVVPSPFTFILPANGDTGPPPFPVRVDTNEAPPLPTVPSCPAEPMNTGIPSAVAGVIPTMPETNDLLICPGPTPVPAPNLNVCVSEVTPGDPISILLLSKLV